MQSFGGEDVYPSIEEKAAHLLYFIIKNHPFVDGNKRVAFAVTDVFLRINDYRITADSQEIFATLMKLFAAQTFDMEHLIPWLERITARRPAI
jgi:death-on-curing protein